MSIRNLFDVNDYTLNVNDAKKFWIFGTPISFSNTDAEFSIVPNTTGFKGSKILTDEMLFGKPYNVIKTNGHAFISVLNTTSTTTKVIFTIDGVPHTLINDTFTGNETIVSQLGEYNTYYKFFPVSATTFDIMIFGDNHYTVPPLAIPLNVGNWIVRPIYVMANNGGAHFTRGTTYELGASYQFSIADPANSATIVHASAEIVQTL